MNGALLVHKHEGVSSFGVIELLQNQLIQEFGIKRRDLPKLGHGGTLDPFATGLLIVLVGRGVKLARYFLGSTKAYDATLRFGETSESGDYTNPICETSSFIPQSIEPLRELAHQLTLQPYLQTPPMYSAKKKNGKPLYELARAGIEVEREPKACTLFEFNVHSYEAPRARISVRCSSGTYIRTLAQDYAKRLGTVGLLDALHRTSSGVFHIRNAWTTEQIKEAVFTHKKKWDELPCWVPFSHLLDGYDRAEATQEEKEALIQGRQNVLFSILKRAQTPAQRSCLTEDCLTIYHDNSLVAIARKEEQIWRIERVFVDG